MVGRHVFFVLYLCAFATAFGQLPEFNRQDTLRGSVTPEREWWDLRHYHLDIQVDPSDSTVAGINTIRYEVLSPSQLMQIDLQPPMQIGEVVQNGNPLLVKQDGYAYFIELKAPQNKGAFNEIELHFGGRPQVAIRPPWDGGLTWSFDSEGRPFIASSCQGDGASLWWPCKDHMYDEPDSMHISITVPEALTAVSNGRLREVRQNPDQTRTFHWFVSNPISNYVINANIGVYSHFSEVFEGEKGKLDCDYYVLTENLAQAKEQFKEVPRMLEAFEHWFGPYPFYEDGYKLVEVPYLGMEHQSSITYGNGYQNGYKGIDLSDTGWGMNFDFIIIHESGHEWFANNITYKDMADMWVHEGFTAYSENLFLDYHFGKKASAEYVIGTRDRIQNDRPIIGPYNVNRSGSGDMYYKGSNILHTLRQIVNDDEKWRDMLRGLNKEFYHQTVTTAQIENYLSEKSGYDLTHFFDQYLRDNRIPVLEYRLLNGSLSYRWNNCIPGFDMPVKVFINKKAEWLTPISSWKRIDDVKKKTRLKVDPGFYVAAFNLTGK